MNRKPVLILAAHPDDEVLGCGGTIQFHRNEGRDVFLCIVTDGSSSQYPNNSAIAIKKDQECIASCEYLGLKKVFRLNFPDMKLDTIPHMELNRALEEIFEKVKPAIVYTHSGGDLNKDHVCINQSTMVVTRPGKDYLKEVLEYEVLSSSEWSRNTAFIPNVYVNIERFIKAKVEAFGFYQTETRKYPHPRSKEGIESLARYRGLQSGYKFAEAFRLIIKYG